LATNVIMPALGIAQETGKVLKWLKPEGGAVAKGEPLMEIETDKVTVEIEAPASGILANVTAADGDEVPVGQVIAVVLAPGETALEPSALPPTAPPLPSPRPAPSTPAAGTESTRDAGIIASPVAARIAARHNLDLRLVKAEGGRIEKADVLAYLENQRSGDDGARRTPASPKARRLARERGLDVATLAGSGPEGAVLAADVLAVDLSPTPAAAPEALTLSNVWRVMAERTTQSWTSVPHFYLLREVNASRLITWREMVQKRVTKITYTDLLVKLVAAALCEHPRLNAAWNEGTITLNDEINVGLAVAVEEGLVVPVIQRADKLSLSEIAARRDELVDRAQTGRLRPEDIRGGTFTISNLGMYGVDAFNAIVNPPQAAVLAVGRIAQRVVPVNGQPAVQPMMVLSLSCDHRVVDGARGAQFLAILVDLIEEPLALLD
ncbi:MAG: 2-oxo acid dehydrogenase subunit E2, partial [Anaerolineae bacterium]